MAIVLGIASDFAADGLKKFWGTVSVRQRRRNEEEQRQIEADAQKCLLYPIYMMTQLGKKQTAESRRNYFALLTYMCSYCLTQKWQSVAHRTRRVIRIAEKVELKRISDLEKIAILERTDA